MGKQSAGRLTGKSMRSAKYIAIIFLSWTAIATAQDSAVQQREEAVKKQEQLCNLEMLRKEWRIAAIKLKEKGMSNSDLYDVFINYKQEIDSASNNPTPEELEAMLDGIKDVTSSETPLEPEEMAGDGLDFFWCMQEAGFGDFAN